MPYPANTDNTEVLALKLHDEVRYLAALAERDGRSTSGVLTARDLGVSAVFPRAVPPRTERESWLEFEPYA